MSGKKDYKVQGDEAMMRAAWDMQADMALGAGITTKLLLTRTARKGVYTIEWQATASEAVWGHPHTASYKVEWPRSEVVSLAAAVFQALHKLDQMCEQSIRSGEWVAVELPF